MNEMIQYFNGKFRLSDLVNNELNEVTKRGTVKKGDYLFTAGMISEHFYFVTQGLLRCYHILESDRRVVTTHFTKEREFFFLPQNLSSVPVEGKENLHALEDTSYCYMAYTDLTGMLNRHYKLYKALFPILVECHERERDAQLTMLQCSPKEKRSWLEENHPELVKRVPQPYLNKYLGMNVHDMRDYRK